MEDYNIITVSWKRGGRPCIRGIRITVNVIPNWLASDMTINEILAEYDELTSSDISAVLSLSDDCYY